MQVPDKLIAAKILAYDIRPYFAAAYHALIPVVDDKLDTFAVDDRWRLYYDPKKVKDWSVQQIATVLYHEISHLLRLHGERAKQFGPSLNHKLWNYACDMEINDDIVEDIADLLKNHKGRGENLPECNVEPTLAAQLKKHNPNWQPGPLTPQLLNMQPGKFAEEYYRALLEIQEQNSKMGNMIAALIESDDQAAGAGACGSCAHGQPEPYQNPSEGMNASDNDPVRVGLSKADADIIGQQVAHDIKDHIKSARGTIPGGWERWANEILQPKVDHMKWLRSCVRSGIAEAAGKQDYTWTRASRRQGAMGSKFFLPGMTSHKPRVGVAIDTSGSMSEKQLARCIAETSGLIRQMGYTEEVVVASCDAAAQNVQKITRIDQILMKGGGGTDMGVALATLEAQKPPLDVMIVLTDCETPWPAERPKAAVVIVKIGDAGQFPPWPCHQVQIPD
jgi:predicted metal-dependent peptidase